MQFVFDKQMQPKLARIQTQLQPGIIPKAAVVAMLFKIDRAVRKLKGI